MHNYRKNKTYTLLKKPNKIDTQQINQISTSFFASNKVQRAKHQYQSQYSRWENLRNQFKLMSVADKHKKDISLWKAQKEIIRNNSMAMDSEKDYSKSKEKFYNYPNESQEKPLKHISSTQNYQKVYKSRARPLTSRTDQHQQSYKNPESNNRTKIPYKLYKGTQKNRKMFRSSLNDMRKIEIYNLEGKEEISHRKIILKKSLVIDTRMHAIQAAQVHKGLVFTCETMGQIFKKTKLAIGPSELKEYSYFFGVFDLQDLANKLFEYLVLQKETLKIEKELLKKDQQMIADKKISILNDCENKVDLEKKDSKQMQESKQMKENGLRESDLPIEESMRISKQHQNQSKIMSDIQEESLIKSDYIKQSMNESKIQQNVSVQKKQLAKVEEKSQEVHHT